LVYKIWNHLIEDLARKYGVKPYRSVSKRMGEGPRSLSMGTREFKRGL